MSKLILEENQIKEIEDMISEDDEYGCQVIDNNLFSINPEINVESGILFISLELISDSPELSIGVSITDSDINIYAYFMIDNAWSNKDDSRCGKVIKNILREDLQYDAVLVERDKIIVFPKSYFIQKD